MQQDQTERKGNLIPNVKEHIESKAKEEPIEQKMISMEQFLHNCKMQFALKPLQRQGFYDVPSLIRTLQPILRVINQFKLSDKEMLELVQVLRTRYIDLCKSGQVIPSTSEQMLTEDMFIQMDIESYQCKACELVIKGEEARNQHYCQEWHKKLQILEQSSRGAYKKQKLESKCYAPKSSWLEIYFMETEQNKWVCKVCRNKFDDKGIARDHFMYSSCFSEEIQEQQYRPANNMFKAPPQKKQDIEPNQANLMDMLTGINISDKKAIQKAQNEEEVKPKYDEELCADLAKIYEKVLNSTIQNTYTYTKQDLDKYKELFEISSQDHQTDDERFSFMKFYYSHDYISPNHLCYIFDIKDTKIAQDWITRAKNNQMFSPTSPFFSRLQQMCDKYEKTKPVKVPTAETLVKILQKKHGQIEVQIMEDCLKFLGYPSKNPKREVINDVVHVTIYRVNG